ncbi:uncharacterized protein LOC124460247 isoform X1 [Drosophila willistoni]|uniref:uncharacterized protein LOC124460247 isoform X1 n=2 Tax=Drosophila willistoni TaxID=7260 RepID=UPI001F07A148|nr:uncharacterized protein LOC124460247 isoform X1 [Drosophila willistoni]
MFCNCPGSLFGKTLTLMAMVMLQQASAAHFFNYDSPVIPLQQGYVWRVSGVFRLIHVINLLEFQQAIQTTREESTLLSDQRTRMIADHYLDQAEEDTGRLLSTPARRPRAVEWLGSAWKWIAGSPDAADWNAALKTQDGLVAGNNQQVRINEKLFEATYRTLEELNGIIGKVNSIDGDIHAATATLHKAMILARQVHEVTRACQLAKTGAVNTDLLNGKEVDDILNEVMGLPYQNAVEAIEFSRPTVMSNGTFLLYVLAIPKVTDRRYKLLHLLPTVREGRKIVLDANLIAVDPTETYEVLGNCLSIGNTTVCQEENLRRLNEEGCIPRLIKGGNAQCHYLRDAQESVTLMDESTVFLTGFNGTVTTSSGQRRLQGSFIIKLQNETITIGRKTYSSRSASALTAMPAVLSNITALSYTPTLQYVHEFSTQNLRKLYDVSRKLKISLLTEAIGTACVGIMLYIAWRKMTSTRGLAIPEKASPSPSP